MPAIKRPYGPTLARLAAAFMTLALAAALSCAKKSDKFTLEAGTSGEDELPVEALRVDELAKAYDGDPATRWSTNCPQRPWFYLSIELPQPRKVSGIILDARPTIYDFPHNFVVEVSRKGGPLTEVLRGDKRLTRKGVTTITFNPPVDADRILITLTQGQPRFYWSIYEMKVVYAD